MEPSNVDGGDKRMLHIRRRSICCHSDTPWEKFLAAAFKFKEPQMGSAEFSRRRMLLLHWNSLSSVVTDTSPDLWIKTILEMSHFHPYFKSHTIMLSTSHVRAVCTLLSHAAR